MIEVPLENKKYAVLWVASTVFGVYATKFQLKPKQCWNVGILSALHIFQSYLDLSTLKTIKIRQSLDLFIFIYFERSLAKCSDISDFCNFPQHWAISLFVCLKTQFFFKLSSLCSFIVSIQKILLIHSKVGVHVFVQKKKIDIENCTYVLTLSATHKLPEYFRKHTHTYITGHYNPSVRISA